MSLQKLPSDRALTFAERHPVAQQIWDDTLKVSKEQVIIPSGMSLATFITSYLRGEIVSIGSAVLWLFLSVLVGVLLYLIMNVIRAPFIVIGRLHQQVANLNQRLIDVEARPPTVVETVPAPVAMIPAPKDEPNLVFKKSEVVQAFIDLNAVVIEGTPDPRSGLEADAEQVKAVIVIFGNMLDPKRKVGGISGISAQITYRFFNNAIPLEISRGVWLTTQHSRVGFGVNDSQRLLIAVVDESEKISVIEKEENSYGGLRKRRTNLFGELFGVHIRLIAESESKVIEEYKFMMEVTREPEFKVELTLEIEWKIHHLSALHTKGFDLRHKLHEVSNEAHERGKAIGDFFNTEILAVQKKQEEEIAEQIREWEVEVAAFIGMHIGERKKSDFLSAYPSIEDGLNNKLRLPPPRLPGQEASKEESTPRYWTLHDTVATRMNKIHELCKRL